MSSLLLWCDLLLDHEWDYDKNNVMSSLLLWCDLLLDHEWDYDINKVMSSLLLWCVLLLDHEWDYDINNVMSSLLLWCDLLLDHEWDNDLKQCYVFTTTMMCPIIGPRVGLWYKQCYVVRHYYYDVTYYWTTSGIMI